MELITNFFANLTAQQVFFYIFAALTVGAALEVVMQRNPFYSAIALVFTLAGLSAHYVLLKAQFLAMIQIIVYAGAIIVLFVFVIMLLNVRTEESRIDRSTSLRWIVLPSVALILVTFLIVINKAELSNVQASPNAVAAGTVESIGTNLFTVYLLPFEALSVLIMMAIVGAMTLAQRAPALPEPEEPKLVEEPEAEPTEPAEPVPAEPEEVEVP